MGEEEEWIVRNPRTGVEQGALVASSVNGPQIVGLVIRQRDGFFDVEDGLRQLAAQFGLDVVRREGGAPLGGSFLAALAGSGPALDVDPDERDPEVEREPDEADADEPVNAAVPQPRSGGNGTGVPLSVLAAAYARHRGNTAAIAEDLTGQGYEAKVNSVGARISKERGKGNTSFAPYPKATVR